MSSFSIKTLASGIQTRIKDPSTRLLCRLSGGHLVSDSFAGFMLPILPIFSRELGFGLEATGFILTVSSMTSSVLQPLWGVLTERYRRVNYILIGLLTAIVCISFLGWSSDYWMLIALVGLGYLGIGILHPRAMTYAHSLGGRNENLVMSVFITAGASGFALGPLISSFLVSNWGLKATVWMLPMVLVGWVLFAGIDQRFLKILAQPRSVRAATPGFTGWEYRALILLSFVAIVRAIILVGLDAFMPFVWTEQGYSLMMIGTVMAVASLVSAPIALYAGYLSDRLGERLIMWLSYLPCIVLIPLMLSSTGFMSFVFFVAIHALIQLSMTANTVVALRSIGHHKNMISGLMAGFSFGVAGLMMPVFGRMGESLGLISALQYLLVPMILGTLALLFIPKSVYLKNKSVAPKEKGT